jgi:hypothetical protein
MARREKRGGCFFGMPCLLLNDVAALEASPLADVAVTAGAAILQVLELAWKMAVSDLDLPKKRKKYKVIKRGKK